MATACLRLRTFAPEDERSEPCLYSRITFEIFPRPLPRPPALLLERRAITNLPRALTRAHLDENRSGSAGPPLAVSSGVVASTWTATKPLPR